MSNSVRVCLPCLNSSCIHSNESTSNVPVISKKTKKSTLTKHVAALDLNDQAALNRRAARFQREHEIERRKNLYGAHHSHLQNSRSPSTYDSRSGTPGPFGDDPEADPVRMREHMPFLLTNYYVRTFQTGIGILSLAQTKRYSRTICG